MKKLILGLLFYTSTFAQFTAVPPTLDPTPLERGGWNNRYIKQEGEFDYLVGFDLQQLHADSNIDYKTELDFLASYDINKVRIWLYPSWFALPGHSSYPTTGKIYYPWKIVNNKFDLDNWDIELWNRAKNVLEYAASKNIIVELSLFTIQEPRNYFRDRPYALNADHNLQNFGTATENDGRFMFGFHRPNHSENGRTTREFQTALVDKALQEFRHYDNIYYEISNEAPGMPFWTLNNSLVHDWIIYWVNYIGQRTDKLVTAHVHGFLNESNASTSITNFDAIGIRYWDNPHLDAFNWHLYSGDPNWMSSILHNYQLKNQMLITNEGSCPCNIDRTPGYPNYIVTINLEVLYKEIRQAWGMAILGGYYGMYFGPVPQLRGEAGIAAAKAMQALRNIMESVPFETLAPVDTNGNEIDSIVSQGPGNDWQVIASIGNTYVIYFWNKRDLSVRINLPEGNYTYRWMETREWKAPLSTGTVVGGSITNIPSETNWHTDAGVVLIVEK
jgi:hypothetical protein